MKVRGHPQGIRAFIRFFPLKSSKLSHRPTDYPQGLETLVFLLD